MQPSTRTSPKSAYYVHLPFSPQETNQSGSARAFYSHKLTSINPTVSKLCIYRVFLPFKPVTTLCMILLQYDTCQTALRSCIHKIGLGAIVWNLNAHYKHCEHCEIYISCLDTFSVGRWRPSRFTIT